MKRSYPGTKWAAVLAVFVATANLAVAAQVAGTVQLTDEGRALPADEIMVALEPVGDAAGPELAPPQTHIVDMKGKVYRPRYLVVSAGDSVVFANSDPFKHNVFSASTCCTFDLGSYGSDTRSHHLFTEIGLAEIYCNVHPEMACFIMVTQSPWRTITGPDGAFSFDGVPAGTYQLRVWHERGSFEQRIGLGAEENILRKIVIETEQFKRPSHKNKYGKKYPRYAIDEESY